MGRCLKRRNARNEGRAVRIGIGRSTGRSAPEVLGSQNCTDFASCVVLVVVTVELVNQLRGWFWRHPSYPVSQ